MDSSGRFRAEPTPGLAIALVLSTVVVACGAANAPVAIPVTASAPAPISAPPPSSNTAPVDVPVVASETAPVVPAPAPPDALPPAPVSEGAPPVDLPKGTTILHIGDSFAGALGIDLDRELKAEGVRGILRYETATYIPTWAFGK